MPTRDDVQRLVEELGPASPDIAGVYQYGDAEWSVAYDETNVVTLEWEEATGKVVLSANLGQPMESRRLEVAEAALDFNTLWQDHGGVWIGRGGVTGELLLMYALTDHGVTLELLGTVIENFAAKATLWRDYVASTDAGDAAPDGQETFGAMRV